MGVNGRLHPFQKFKHFGTLTRPFDWYDYYSVSCFDFSQLLKKHTLNYEITLLYQFHAQKANYLVPKICNIDFWIENDTPSPPWNFSENSSNLVAPPFPYCQIENFFYNVL